MRKYDPFTTWLKSQKDTRLVVAFDTIEQIIGDQLPRSARTYRPWWGNELGASSRQCSAWLAGGWHVQSVDLADGTVTLMR